MFDIIPGSHTKSFNVIFVYFLSNVFWLKMITLSSACCVIKCHYFIHNRPLVITDTFLCHLILCQMYDHQLKIRFEINNTSIIYYTTLNVMGCLEFAQCNA